jgi:HEAT repeat protein
MKRRLLVYSLGLFLVSLDAGLTAPAEPTVGETVPQPLGDASNKKDDESLSRLAALKDKDPKVRRQAADALGRLRDKAATEPLVAALKDDDRGVRWSAASALGALGDRRAVAPLIAAMDDPDAWVHHGVASALGNLGDKRAVEPLHAALKRSDGSVDVSAACALAAIVKDGSAVEPLLAALEHPESEWTGLEVCISIMRIGPAAVKPLTAALGHSSFRVRRHIVEFLALLGDESAVEPLIKALNDPEGDVARAVAWALSVLDDPRAVAPLAAAIKDRGSAVWRESSSSSPLEKTERFPSLTTGVPADLAPLVSAMEDPRWQLRYSAAWVLGRLGDKRAVEALAKVLKAAEKSGQHEEKTRGVWFCAQALARLKTPLAVAPLLAVLKQLASDQMHDHDDMGSPELNDRMHRMRQKEISKALEALAAVGPAAIDPLLALLKDQKPGVRAAAAQGLGKLGDKRAIAALQTTQHDPSQQVRHSATEAIRAISLNKQK